MRGLALAMILAARLLSEPYVRDQPVRRSSWPRPARAARGCMNPGATSGREGWIFTGEAASHGIQADYLCLERREICGGWSRHWAVARV